MTYASIGVTQFISEREGAHLWVDGKTQDDSHWEDCVDTSLVMLALDAKPGVASATLKEAETLRWKAGLPAMGGTTPGQYKAAILARYGLSMKVFSGSDDALVAAIPVGYAAAVCGNPSKCASTSPFRKYLPLFNGGHCVLIEHLPTGFRLIDPMGPEDGAYHGLPITEADLRLFYTGVNGDVAILPMAVIPDPKPEESMLTNLDLPALVQFDAPVGVQVYDEAGAPLFKSTVAIAARQALYTVPVAGVSYRVFAGSDGTTRRLLLVKASDCQNVKPVVLTSGITQSQVDAAVAAQYTKDMAGLEAATAAAKQAGIDAQKADIRAKLGL